MFRRRFVIAFAAITAALVLVAADADARVGGGSSGGSRGMRTFSPPPVTRTAPNTAAPIQRSVTQPSKAGTVGQASARPGFFGSGLLGGLAAGFSAPVSLACCSGTDYSVGWPVLRPSSVSFCRWF
jgi:hypothetical protein